MKSHLGSLKIDSVKMEIIGDIQIKFEGEWEEPVDINKCRRFIELEGEKIPVISLDREAEAYRKLGRERKAKEIRKHLGRA